MDARLLRDRISSWKGEEPGVEADSVRRFIEIVDYVSEVHRFILTNPIIARESA